MKSLSSSCEADFLSRRRLLKYLVKKTSKVSFAVRYLKTLMISSGFMLFNYSVNSLDLLDWLSFYFILSTNIAMILALTSGDVS